MSCLCYSHTATSSSGSSSQQSSQHNHVLVASSLENLSHLELPSPNSTRIPRAMSTSAIATSTITNSVYTNVWKMLLQLSKDPEPQVFEMAKAHVSLVRAKVSTSCFNVFVQNSVKHLTHKQL